MRAAAGRGTFAGIIKDALKTSYSYTPAGDLESIQYSDNITPAVFYSYDRRGRRSAVTDAAGTTTFSWSEAGQPLDEIYAANSPLLPGFQVQRAYDPLLRRTSLELRQGVDVLAATGYSYDGASGRLAIVTKGLVPNVTDTFAYTYRDKTDLVESVTSAHGATTAMTTTRIYDNLLRLRRIASVQGAAGPTLVSHAWGYNAAGQRELDTRQDGSYWQYAYDELGQVKDGKKHWDDEGLVAGQQFEYTFDSIGNRTLVKSGGDADGNGLRAASYSANNINLYTACDLTPRSADVLGTANATATVSVTGQAVSTHDLPDAMKYYRGEVTVTPDGTLDNVKPAQTPTVTVKGVRRGGGPGGQDIVATQEGALLFPQDPEAFTYDADGNLLTDGQFDYTWDAENRLIAVETRTGLPAAVPRVKLEFVYDHLSRRIAKRVCTRTMDNGPWTMDHETRFVYDGWNLIAELSFDDQSSTFSVLRSHVWGLDLSGSLQGAGGVGGLLSSSSSSQYFCFDGNGNVVALVDSGSGAVSATYEFDPFGNLLAATGPAAAANPFRFSTKYLDTETSLYYYGYRYYSPDLGRWINRDPLAEEGGLNLHAFCSNDPVDRLDPLGLRELSAEEKAALAKIETLRASAAADERFKAIAEKIGDFVKDFKEKVAAVPAKTKDPAGIAITSTALIVWDKDNAKFSRERGQEQDTPVKGLSPLSKDIVTTCNYFVADVLQRAVGVDLAKRSFRLRSYPPVANVYAKPESDVRLSDFRVTDKGQMGDVVSFPVEGDSGHVGIYLGYDIYISSRTGDDAPGTMGKDHAQPYSGVQIKEVPAETESRHVIIRYQK